MAVQIEDVDVLSEGEFIELMRGMPRGEAGSGTLQAMHQGIPVPPHVAYAALNVEARMRATTPKARKIADAGCKRIKRAFPEVG
jgi:hypothetical protein